ncbi:MAG: pyridoxal-phosphate dependent enzyme [Lachnospiraceae bacterium]|nr:pyridoxal-phosphate dependent enzyme [Lachnospiraceae bacterium]
MAKINNSILELVGATPLVRLHGLEREEQTAAEMFAKIEYRNPSRSVADRLIPVLIRTAEEQGLLHAGDTIIEAADGNSGVSLAQIAAVKGYALTLVLPASANREYRKLIGGFGAKVILTPRQLGPEGARQKAQELHAQIAGSVMPIGALADARQEIYGNSIGSELWQGTGGRIDVLVAVDAGDGLAAGVGTYIKGKDPQIRVVVGRIEPATDTDGNYDEVISVGQKEAYRTTLALAQKEGILAGISSGAAVYTALQVAKRPENKGKRIVVLLNDTGERYLSTEVFGAVLAPPDPF